MPYPLNGGSINDDALGDIRFQGLYLPSFTITMFFIIRVFIGKFMPKTKMQVKDSPKNYYYRFSVLI
jgi:hypothetical protein